MFALIFLCVLSPATSFLLDVSTPIPPKAGTFITDEHYNALMDLFIQERHSRQNLEKYVIQLNQRMTKMAKDVASTTIKVGVLEKTSSNVDMQEAFRNLKNNSEIIKQEYNSLLLEHSNLKREVNAVTQRNNQLQIEVDSLKQLKTIVSLQSLANVNNFTVHLENEIQNTNNIVHKVLSDENARKQDFIALVNVTNVLKKRLSDTQLSLDQKFKDTSSLLSKVQSDGSARKQDSIALMNATTVLKTRLSDTQLSLDKKFKNIEIKQNLTVAAKVNELENHFDSNIRNLTVTSQTIMAKLTENNRRVALTACANIVMVNFGDEVKFPNVINSYGLQNVTSFKQTGIFTCEQKGLYMFFSNMMSTSKDGYFRWYLNNSRYVSGVYIGYQTQYQSGSGMVTVELAVGDTVSLKSQRSNIFVNHFSCYTLIKIK